MTLKCDVNKVKWWIVESMQTSTENVDYESIIYTFQIVHNMVSTLLSMSPNWSKIKHKLVLTITATEL